MSQTHSYLATAFGLIAVIISVGGLSVGAALLWRSERRASGFLWGAAAAFLLRTIVSTVANFVVYERLPMEQAVIVTWAVDAVFHLLAWTLITAALLMIARALRDPRREPARSVMSAR